MVLPLNDVSDGVSSRPVVARDFEELQRRITPSLLIIAVRESHVLPM